MKAILFHQHGGPEVLEYADFPTSEPGPGEVLIQLEAAALNRMDLWVRNGWPGLRLSYPHIPGADGVGKVAALGKDVTQWQICDRAYPLNDARAAQMRLESGEQLGKITLQISP